MQTTLEQNGQMDQPDVNEFDTSSERQQQYDQLYAEMYELYEEAKLMNRRRSRLLHRATEISQAAEKLGRKTPQGSRLAIDLDELRMDALSGEVEVLSQSLEFGEEFGLPYDFALSNILNEKLKKAVMLLDEVRFKISVEVYTEDFLHELNQGTKRITSAIRRLDQDPIV
jgi:hypothetical protein